MQVKVVTTKLASSALAHTPVELSRIGGTESGRLNLNHRDLTDVPLTDVRLFSIFSRVEAGRQSCQLLLFLQGQRRPLLVDGFKIQYGDFPIPRADTVVPQLRHFGLYVHQENPNVGVDRPTFEFLAGKPPRVLERDVVVLATALGNVLQKVDTASQ